MTFRLPKFRLLDLSVTLLANNPYTDPPGLGPEIEYADHRAGLAEFQRMFPGLRDEDLADGEGPGVERLRMTAHNGTHMDAPWHYASTMDGGKPAATIEQVPLEWCLQPGVKLDFRNCPDGYVVTASDIEDELQRIHHTLAPLEIVVVNTAAGAKYGRPEYIDTGCGMGRAATLSLLERGVRVVGTDGWSWDAPFSFTRKRFSESGDPSIIWEGHKAGRDIGYGQMEKLANLDQLPSDGFWISCFPFKIERGSAGFIRAVALLPEC
jgi:kynurenine formamidase